MNINLSSGGGSFHQLRLWVPFPRRARMQERNWVLVICMERSNVAVDDEVKATHAWIKPLSPVSVSEKSLIVRKLPAPQRITASFFLDIDNFTAVYERTSSVASVTLSKGIKEKPNFSLALSIKGCR